MEKTKENINLIIPPTDGEKLNPEVKADWLVALRSGEYKQATGRLCKLNGPIRNNPDDGDYVYCCMGVLTDRYHKTTGNGKWVYNGNYFQGKNFAIGEDKEGRKGDSDLPVAVQEWAGLTSDRIRGHLAQLNDGVHLNFYEIADWIEENL